PRTCQRLVDLRDLFHERGFLLGLLDVLDANLHGSPRPSAARARVQSRTGEYNWRAPARKAPLRPVTLRNLRGCQAASLAAANAAKGSASAPKSRPLCARCGCPPPDIRRLPPRRQRRWG